MARSFLIAIALVVASGCGGCKEEAPPAPTPPPVVEEEAPVVEAPPYLQMREAFGLPFPPDVQYVRKGHHSVEVGTSMRIDEVEKFFKLRLVDYEFFRPTKSKIQIIGLHSSMPRIWVMYRAPKHPVAVHYIEQVGELARHEDKPEPAEPGASVRAKLPDGKPLAPGARYGEPYTPQPGDPLYQERYRANFGKPFGKWVLN